MYKIRVLNSKLYSFFKDVKASKLVKLFDLRSVSSGSIGPANEINQVFTIPPDLPLSDPERSVLAKGLPTPTLLICSLSRKIPKLFSAVYVFKPIFTISPPPIIRIFLNKLILKSLLGSI